jgi:hypothetical protein
MNSQRLFCRTQRQRLTAGVFVVCLGLALSAQVAGPVAGQGREGARAVVNALPPRLPLKVVVKNRELVADPKNESWLRDLEVEVTNTGSRPVYFVSLLLLLPGAKMGGLQPVYKLRFGNPALGSFTAIARPEDVPLAPGESAVVKVSEGEALMWEKWRARGAATEPQKLVLVLHQLNFGDGTGLVGQDGRRMPNPNAGYRRRRR